MSTEEHYFGQEHRQLGGQSTEYKPHRLWNKMHGTHIHYFTVLQ